jgi:hypothetical protein
MAVLDYYAAELYMFFSSILIRFTTLSHSNAHCLSIQTQDIIMFCEPICADYSRSITREAFVSFIYLSTRFAHSIHFSLMFYQT